MIKKQNITYFDLETTGLDINAIGLVSIYAVNYKKKRTIDSLINPEIEIPIAASNVHHILNEDVKDKPVFKNIIKPIDKLFNDSDYICGYNICKYDMPLIISLFERNDVELNNVKNMKFIDLFYIIKRIIPKEDLDEIGRLTLSNIYNFVTGKELDAHDAKNDVIACVEMLDIFEKQDCNWRDYILTYEDLTGSVISDENFVMKYGKHEGRSISDLILNESKYIKWMSNKKLIKLNPDLVNLILENNE